MAKKNTVDYKNLAEMNDALAKHFYTDAENAGIYINGAPARNLDHVESYLNGNAHDRSKITYFDGKKFHRII